MPTRVVSIGYERRSVDELISLLQDQGVEKLVDVREVPLSRRKGFSKQALARRLHDAGIEYVHLLVAGNPHHREKGNVERCLQLYSNHLDGHPEIVDVVAAELMSEPAAVLCYERSHRYCHRSILLGALQARGHPVAVIKVE